MNNEEMKKAVWTIVIAGGNIIDDQKKVLSLPEKYFEVGDKTKLKIYLEQAARIMGEVVRKMRDENKKTVDEAILEFFENLDDLNNFCKEIDNLNKLKARRNGNKKEY